MSLNNLNKSLRLGIISYINSLPFYKDIVSYNNKIKKYITNLQFEIFLENPKVINNLILNNKLDIGIVSSYVYLKNKDKLKILTNIGIAAKYKVMSVVLLSKYDLNEFSHKTIIVTDESETSIQLLKIIIEIFYKNIKVNYIKTKINENNIEELILSNEIDAIMLIGDLALKVYQNYYLKSYININTNNFKIYDLCNLWYKFTKLPFVFALFVVRKDYLMNFNICQMISWLLKKGISKNSLLSIINLITNKSKNDNEHKISIDMLKKYYKCLNYKLTDSHLKSLTLFEKLIKKMENIKSETV